MVITSSRAPMRAGEGAGAGGFAQVVLGGAGDLGLGAVEVEVV
jgi:hypothetical protein